MNTTTVRARRPLAALGALALVGVIGAGCSHPPAKTDTAGTTATTTARSQAVKFSECMRTNGISDFPDPDASGDFDYGISVSPEVWQSTLAACQDLQPPGTFSAERSTEQQAAALRFAQCIRDNGVADFPDPVNGDPLIDTTKIPSTDQPDGMTILNAAMKSCDALGQAAIVHP